MAKRVTGRDLAIEQILANLELAPRESALARLVARESRDLTPDLDAPKRSSETLVFYPPVPESESGNAADKLLPLS